MVPLKTLLFLPVMLLKEKEDWGMMVEAGAKEEDLLLFEGICNENAPRFRRTNTIEIMLAIDPDIAPDEAES